MEQKRWTKFPVLFTLYVAQSIPMSFFSTVVPVIMRQENFSLQSIGLLQLVKLPWIIKFLYAPIVDNGTRTNRQLRRWIFGSEIFYAAIILIISLFSLKTNFLLIIGLMVAAFIAAGFQDIAVDIFAIRSLSANERSVGNSIQSSGSFIGALLGTGVLLIVYHYIGWSPLLWLLTALVLLALTPLGFYKQQLPSLKNSVKRVSMADIFRFFKLPGAPMWVLILVLYNAGIIGILTMLKPYLVDHGYGIKEIGFMSGIFGTAVASITAFAGGFIVKKIGRKVSLSTFILLSAAAGLMFWLLSAGHPSTAELYTAIALLWGGYGISTVVIYTISMDKVRKGCEGTDFTLQIVIMHLSSLIFAVISGKIAQMIGYHNFFGTQALLSLITFATILLLKKRLIHED